ncbi:MAG TPA: hypothetical protein VJN18_06080 [Polyangiaceae bacterium]|nr:hypothetical protein [Polyangiaceae bacterium]
MSIARSSAASSCPHCGALAIVEPHAALGFRCAVCGGPRLVLDAPEVELGAPAQAALKTAGRKHTRHVVLSAAGLALSGLGALALLVASGVLLAASPGLLPTLFTLLACSVPLGVGLWALRAAAAARSQRSEALHAARLAALSDAQTALGALDGTRASQLLQIDPEQAELLLAEASVAALLEQAAPRLRVDAEPAAPPATPEATADASATEAPLLRKSTEP